MLDSTAGDGFVPPVLTLFCRLDELALAVTGQRLEPDKALLACRATTGHRWYRSCGASGERGA